MSFSEWRQKNKKIVKILKNNGAEFGLFAKLKNIKFFDFVNLYLIPKSREQDNKWIKVSKENEKLILKIDDKIFILNRKVIKK